ncbi:MAG: 16S rRNA (guanine(527)-N(7))-methyltransferase RsmG [Phycisphaerales bacterium]
MRDRDSARASTDAPSASPGAPSPADRPAYLDATPLTPPPAFLEAAGAIGVSFDAGEVERLGRYLAFVLEANKSFNLTAIEEPSAAWERHILDALTLLPVLAEATPEAEGEPLCLIDVGSGAGLPGIPLAIARPDVRVTLLDATAKKCDFLRACALELGLSNVEVVCARAEQAGQDRGARTAGGRAGALRDAYDIVVARAVGRLATLAELTVPFARVGALVALVKGEKADEELAEAKQALHMLHAAHAGTIQTPTGRIVVLEKVRATPKIYPRRDGEPKRSPLGVEAARKRTP